jgi:hypothetical protein
MIRAPGVRAERTAVAMRGSFRGEWGCVGCSGANFVADEINIRLTVSNCKHKISKNIKCFLLLEFR